MFLVVKSSLVPTAKGHLCVLRITNLRSRHSFCEQDQLYFSKYLNLVVNNNTNVLMHKNLVYPK